MSSDMIGVVIVIVILLVVYYRWEDPPPKQKQIRTRWKAEQLSRGNEDREYIEEVKRDEKRAEEELKRRDEEYRRRNGLED